MHKQLILLLVSATMISACDSFTPKKHTRHNNAHKAQRVWGKAGAPIGLRIQENSREGGTLSVTVYVKSQREKVNLDWSIPAQVRLVDGFSSEQLTFEQPGQVKSISARFQILGPNSKQALRVHAYDFDNKEVGAARSVRLKELTETEKEKLSAIRDHMKAQNIQIVE